MFGGPTSISALASGGLFGGRVAVASPIHQPSNVPTVERLSVTVVTDSYHHAFEPAISNAVIKVERSAFHVAPERRPTMTLQNEWGLSLHIESEREDQCRRLLLDFGYTPHTLLNNLEILGVDVSKIDALALSHGHVDHFGGMAGFLAAHKSQLRPDLPIFVGGEECFCERKLIVRGSDGHFGAVDRAAIRDAGLVVTFSDYPSVIANHGVATGRIPLETFEKVLAPTRMAVDLPDLTDRTKTRVAAPVGDTDMIPDDFAHEIAIAYHVRHRGLVVMTSCGHRGVVNSVRAAMQATGASRILAVMGGFHLAPHSLEYQRLTAAALMELEPEFVIPMHCSGEAFIRIVADEMQHRFVRSSTGTTFRFSA